MTAEQQQAEGASRLADEQSRSTSQESARAKKKMRIARLRIVKALPDAFRYEYAGLENGDSELGKVGDKLVRLKFSPNPASLHRLTWSKC